MRGGPLPYVVLLLWLPILVAAFAVLRPQVATLVAFLGTALLLPERRAFDVTGLPPLGKQEVAALGALLGTLLFHSRRLRAARPGLGPEIFVIGMALTALGTVATNSDRQWLGTFWAPALRLKDSVSMVAGDVLVFGIPVLVGRTFFRTARDLRLLMVSLALAGFLYSLPTLFEIRMSPMLNYWVYGYSQHSWAQAKRFGGWRPMMFMAHGLALALFLAVTAIVATSVARARLPVWRLPTRPVAVWIATVLVLCKSTGAILLGAVFVPFAALARSRTMLRVAVGVALLVSLYPMARAADLVPTDALVEAADHISEERAASLRFRFENEAALLDRARERLVFGWGGYGRNRVFRDTLERSDTVPDGFWIIVLGIHGVAGLACFYGLVFTPVVQAWRHGRRAPPGADRYLLGGLSLAVAVYVIDTIPNGLFTNLPVFMAGALSGVAPAVARAARGRRPGASASRRAQAAPPPSPRGDRPARRGATTREVREATYRRRHLD